MSGEVQCSFVLCAGASCFHNIVFAFELSCAFSPTISAGECFGNFCRLTVLFSPTFMFFSFFLLFFSLGAWDTLELMPCCYAYNRRKTGLQPAEELTIGAGMLVFWSAISARSICGLFFLWFVFLASSFPIKCTGVAAIELFEYAYDSLTWLLECLPALVLLRWGDDMVGWWNDEMLSC